MDKIIDHLLSRLSHKGIIPLHVPCLIRDMLNIVRDDRRISTEGINTKLESLGWGQEILDDFTLDLILHVTDRALININTPHERHVEWNRLMATFPQ